MASVLYIDGLGLYYGSVRGTPYKWLNLESLATALDLEPPVIRVHYFVTKDPDSEGRKRQEAYLAALRTLRRVRVHEVDGTHAIAELTQRMLEDDRAAKYELAALLTIDGRLAEPLSRLNAAKCAVMPYVKKRKDPSITHAADFHKRINKHLLETNQLEFVLSGLAGETIVKPAEW
jgi:hypothetical protein